MAQNALLRLSSRGEALVAEMLRLSSHIPPLFMLAEKAEKAAYDAVLLARPGLSAERPEWVAAIRERVCDAIDARAMRELNRLVDADGRSPSEAAATFGNRARPPN